MSTFKKVMIITSFAIALIVLVTYGLSRSQGTDQQPANGGNFPSGSGVIELPIYSGDVRTLPETEALGNGLFQLTTLDPRQRTDFDILYNETNDSYAVSLNVEPLDSARRNAEEFLLRTLQKTEAELCDMNIFMTTTYETNTFLAGENLGLSFCEDSFDL